MTNNVIIFPKGKSGAPPQTLDEIKENVGKVREHHIQTILESAMPHLVEVMLDSGVDVTEDDNMPLFAMWIETTKALISKSAGVPHPFDDLAKEHFSVMDDGISLNYTFDLNPDE